MMTTRCVAKELIHLYTVRGTRSRVVLWAFFVADRGVDAINITARAGMWDTEET